MGLSDKYGYVATTRHGRTGPIGENEPVAVFRAQDELSIDVLRYYYNLCVRAGCSSDHLASLDRQLTNFERWQAQNPTRTPGTMPAEAR